MHIRASRGAALLGHMRPSPRWRASPSPMLSPQLRHGGLPLHLLCATSPSVFTAKRFTAKFTACIKLVRHGQCCMPVPPPPPNKGHLAHLCISRPALTQPTATKQRQRLIWLTIMHLLSRTTHRRVTSKYRGG